MVFSRGFSAGKEGRFIAWPIHVVAARGLAGICCSEPMNLSRSILTNVYLLMSPNCRVAYRNLQINLIYHAFVFRTEVVGFILWLARYT